MRLTTARWRNRCGPPGCPAGDGIEATAFHQMSERAWQELAEEACAQVSFLAARDPAVYHRFAHWWKELPAAEVRLLPA